MDTVFLGARLLLSAMFLVAGTAKLADQQGSRKAIIDFGIPSSFATSLGFFLPLIEIVIAVTLIPQVSAWWGAIGALILLLVFVAGISVNLMSGRKPDCHCFGQLHSAPAGWSMAARNAGLAAVAFWVVWQGADHVGPGVGAWLSGLKSAPIYDLLAVGVLLGLFALGQWFLMRLFRQNERLLIRLKALKTQVAAFSKRTPVPPDPARALGLPVGSLAPRFQLSSLSGPTVTLDDLRGLGKSILLVFSDPLCGPCKAVFRDLANWAEEHVQALNIVLISRGTIKDNRVKFGGQTAIQILLQQDRELARAYNCPATPGAILIHPDGRIASTLAVGAHAIGVLIAIANKRLDLIGEITGTNPSSNHAGPPPSPLPAKIGDPAPDLMLPDLIGNMVSLSDSRDRPTLVLFWNPNCDFCSRILNRLKAWESKGLKHALQLLVVSTGSVEQNRAMGLQSKVLLDEGFRVLRTFGAPGTPSAVLINKGKIASAVAVGADEVWRLTGWEEPTVTGA
jgi:peroxiredoxin